MSDGQSEGPGRIILQRSGSIGWMCIHNPARLNAMSLSMWHQLASCVRELDDDPEIRVILLGGDGGKAFCAGGDISEFDRVRSGEEAASGYNSAGSAAMAALHGASKPTIAVIRGFCLGGGLGLALQCDLRLAAADAVLGIPAVRRGIAYGYGSVRQLVDLIGPGNAINVLVTGRRFSAAEALSMGLINEVHDADAIGSAATSLAGTIAGNAPLAVRSAKFMVQMALRDPAERDLTACTALEAACLASEDYREATRAFMEKRPPVFRGR